MTWTLGAEDRAWLDGILAVIAATEAGPTATDLADAPVINLWRPLAAGSGAIALCGYASDHPRLGNALITTSQLVSLDARAGFARTASRWYRLGLRLPPAEVGDDIVRVSQACALAHDGFHRPYERLKATLHRHIFQPEGDLCVGLPKIPTRIAVITDPTNRLPFSQALGWVWTPCCPVTSNGRKRRKGMGCSRIVRGQGGGRSAGQQVWRPGSGAQSQCPNGRGHGATGHGPDHRHGKRHGDGPADNVGCGAEDRSP